MLNKYMNIVWNTKNEFFFIKKKPLFIYLFFTAIFKSKDAYFLIKFPKPFFKSMLLKHLHISYKINLKECKGEIYESVIVILLSEHKYETMSF